MRIILQKNPSIINLCIFARGPTRCILAIFGDNIEHKFGRGKFFIIYMAWGIILNVAVDPASTIWELLARSTFIDTHRGKMVSAILVCISKHSTICHRWIRNCWRRRGIYGAHWRFCCRIRDRICVQKNVQSEFNIWNAIRLAWRLRLNSRMMQILYAVDQGIDVSR